MENIRPSSKTQDQGDAWKPLECSAQPWTPLDGYPGLGAAFPQGQSLPRATAPAPGCRSRPCIPPALSQGCQHNSLLSQIPGLPHTGSISILCFCPSQGWAQLNSSEEVEKLFQELPASSHLSLFTGSPWSWLLSASVHQELDLIGKCVFRASLQLFQRAFPQRRAP